jgi:peptide-methionine (R)-S-oxide reductase
MTTWNDVLNLADHGNATPPRRVEKTDEEWRAQLDPLAYQVTRHAATERAFSDPMCSRFESGRYECVCCGTLLFDAAEKFESGTGWPSFTAPAADDVIAYHVDRTHGMVRVETVCNVCDAHLGHVFPDGPAPTGLRYCMNAAALHRVGDGAPV